MKRMLIIFSTLFVLVGCSNDEAYNNAVQKGLDYLASEEYEKAESAFELALDEKKDDEKATTLLNQTIYYQEAVKAMEEADFDVAKEKSEGIIELEDGSSALIKKAEDILSAINELETRLADVTKEFETATKQLEDKQYNDANELVEKILEMDLEHAIFTSIKEDTQALQEDINTALEAEQKAKEEEKLAKEKAEKEEQEKLAREKAEKEKEKEKEKQASKGVGAFKGYWLQDTMACHITDTYIACALAESDFITYDEVTNVKVISDTHIEITLEYGTPNAAYLIDQNTLELNSGIYHRVSAEEANAIYGGQYTLP